MRDRRQLKQLPEGVGRCLGIDFPQTDRINLERKGTQVETDESEKVMSPWNGIVATLRGFLHCRGGSPSAGYHATLTAVTLFVAVAPFAVPAPDALAAGDANQPECPKTTEESPGFRTYLPDCRAYEMVSPPYGAGFEISGGLNGTGSTAIMPIAKSGERVGGLGLGAFAGAEYSYISGGGLGIPYVFQRGVAGWGTDSVMPSASQLPSPVLLDYDTSLAQSLWKSGDTAGFGELTAPVRLYLRAEDGAFTPTGPLTPGPIANGLSEGANGAAEYLGASADLTRIVFALFRAEGQTPTPYWPGDQTVAPSGPVTFSLYEYPAAGATEPALVGVKNSEPLEAAAQKLGKPHINEAAEQISLCGIELGGGNQRDVYNAVSPSSFGIFFTAIAGPCAEGGTGPTVNELYVRVAGTHTLALSEPPLTLPGRACTDVCAESQNEENGHMRSAASFAGASESGHRVFFTTAQPLVDEDTDETSDLYMEELNSNEVAKLVDVSLGEGTAPTPGEGALVQGVSRVSEDGSRVYFVAEGVLTESANANGETASLSSKNLYVYDVQTRSTAFVARLAQADEFAPFGVWSPEDRREAQVSAQDGRYFVFVSRAHLQNTGDTSGNGENVGQLFEYDAASGTVTRVSIGQKGQFFCQTTGLVESGYNCNGNVQANAKAPKIRQQEYAIRDFANSSNMQVNVASDGSVFFESAAALTPGAANGFPNFEPGFKNVYEYRDENVFLISDGIEPAGGTVGSTQVTKTTFVSATNDGGALFLTAEPLVPQDTNSQVSVYDAHIDGGFPPPPVPTRCEGEGCRPTASVPAGAKAASTAVQGLGNLQLAKHHHRRRHHKRGKRRRPARSHYRRAGQ